MRYIKSHVARLVRGSGLGGIFARGFGAARLPHCALLPQLLPLVVVVVAPTTPVVVQGPLRVYCVLQLPLAPLGR